MISLRPFPCSARLLLKAAVRGVVWSAIVLSPVQAQEKSKKPNAETKKPADRAATPSRSGSGSAARRAIAAMRSGDWKTARTAWEEVVSLEPESAAALSNLGKVQYQLSDFPAAMESLEKAVRLKPDLVDSWLTLGMTYLEQKAPMMAVSAMTRGVAENPADPRAHNSLAIVLKRVGWTNGAEAELQKALDLNPDYGEAHFNLAVMYLERKPPALEMARRHYQRSLELGSAADALVEKQLRGESEIEEENVENSAKAEENSPPSSPPPAVKDGSKPSPAAVKRGSPRKS